MRKKKKLNKKNLVKLIIASGCLLIPIIDYISLFVWMFKGTTVGFTWYGFAVDCFLIMIAIFILDDLFN